MKQEKLFKLTVSGLLIAGFASSADAELKNVVVSAPENATVSITKKKDRSITSLLKHMTMFQRKCAMECRFSRMNWKPALLSIATG